MVIQGMLVIIQNKPTFFRPQLYIFFSLNYLNQKKYRQINSLMDYTDKTFFSNISDLQTIYILYL